MGWELWARGVGVSAAMAALALSGTGCAQGAGQAGQARQPMGHLEVKRLESPDDAPDEAKTVQVAYVFDRDLVNKEFKKSFTGGFDKNGIKVDEQLDARAHFEVSGAKITGTVTYVKKGMGRYSILDADLVAEAHYDADVQMDLDVKVKGDTKKASEKDWNDSALHGKPYPLVKNMMPANIPIVGPLFLHAHFDLNAACEIGVEGQMHATAGVGIKGDVRLAARYKKAGFESAEKPDEKKKFKFEAKAPNFELSPKPYLKVEGKQQSIKGWCSLQPTAVLLVENMLGASMVVEPWIEMEAKRASTRQPWQLGAEVGFTVSAAPELRVFGRKIGKRKEFEIMEITLAKMTGPELGRGPAPAKGLPVDPPRPSRAAPTEVAALSPDFLNNSLGGPDRAARPSASASASSPLSEPPPATTAIARNAPTPPPAAPPSPAATTEPPSSAPAVLDSFGTAASITTSASPTPSSSAPPSNTATQPASPPSAPSLSPSSAPGAATASTVMADARPAPLTPDTDDTAQPKPKPKPKNAARSPKALQALKASLPGASAAKPVSRSPAALGVGKLFRKKR